ncbi:hypothetical protein KIPB_002991 [Kipferlia bialata]|uniref:Uncharacterized protein n=1 Tax=Kipferlia bialata TaxID=797122 RepID=A0A9K3GGD7_9EUKA|nr:hypothetical protein KIPB_002991 [Kipferlia bialata]|eukprot:g2991.t1
MSSWFSRIQRRSRASASPPSASAPTPPVYASKSFGLGQSAKGECAREGGRLYLTAKGETVSADESDTTSCSAACQSEYNECWDTDVNIDCWEQRNICKYEGVCGEIYDEIRGDCYAAEDSCYELCWTGNDTGSCDEACDDVYDECMTPYTDCYGLCDQSYDSCSPCKRAYSYCESNCDHFGNHMTCSSDCEWEYQSCTEGVGVCDTLWDECDDVCWDTSWDYDEYEECIEACGTSYDSCLVDMGRACGDDQACLDGAIITCEALTEDCYAPCDECQAPCDSSLSSCGTGEEECEDAADVCVEACLDDGSLDSCDAGLESCTDDEDTCDNIWMECVMETECIGNCADTYTSCMVPVDECYAAYQECSAPCTACTTACDATQDSCIDTMCGLTTACQSVCDSRYPVLTWTSIPEFGVPPARRISSLLLKTVDEYGNTERLVMFGGTDTITFYNDVWYYNMGSYYSDDDGDNTWVKAPVRGVSPPARANAVGFISGSLLYIGLGYESDTYYSDLWVLDMTPSQMVWREIQTPLTPRLGAFGSAVQVESCLETIGAESCTASCRETSTSASCVESCIGPECYNIPCAAGCDTSCAEHCSTPSCTDRCTAVCANSTDTGCVSSCQSECAESCSDSCLDSCLSGCVIDSCTSTCETRCLDTSLFQTCTEACTNEYEELGWCWTKTAETCLMIFGGMVGTDELIRETWLFTPSTETFSLVPETEDTPVAAANGCAVGEGTAVYIYGGFGGNDEYGAPVGNNVISKFDTEIMEWSTVWEADFGEEAVLIQNMGCYISHDIYSDSPDDPVAFLSVFGQDVVTGEVYDVYRSLDLASCPDCGWTVEMTNEEQSRHSFGLVYDYWDEAYAFGGWDSVINNNIVKMYPSGEDSWDSYMDVINPSFDGGPPTGLVGAAFATSGDSVYAFGGKTGTGTVLNNLHAFNSTATCLDRCESDWIETGHEECTSECDMYWCGCAYCDTAYDSCCTAHPGNIPSCDAERVGCYSQLIEVVEGCQAEQDTCLEELSATCATGYYSCEDALPVSCYDEYAECEGDDSDCWDAYRTCYDASPYGICENAYDACYYDSDTYDERQECYTQFEACYYATPAGLCENAYYVCMYDTAECDAEYDTCVTTITECTCTNDGFDACVSDCDTNTGCEETCAPAPYYSPPEPNWITRPTMEGSMPTARYDAMMVSFGPMLMVFGGQDSDGTYLDDEFTYHIDIKEVNAQIGLGDRPSARSSGAVTTVGETLILFGGMGTEGVLGDFYTFSYFDKVWTKYTFNRYSAQPKLTSASLFFIPVGEAEREGTYSLRDGYLYLCGGVSDSMVCEGTVYKVSVHGGKGGDWLGDGEVYLEEFDLVEGPDGTGCTINTAHAASPVSVIGSRVLSTGGRSNETSNPVGTLRVMDFSPVVNANVTEIYPQYGTTMERNRMNTMQGVFGTSLYSIGGYLVESPLAPEGQAVPEIWTTVLGDPCDPSETMVSTACYPCSRGTVYAKAEGDTPAHCEPCGTGHFAAHDGMTKCTACPAGFYNAKAYGDSRLFCLACPSGTYNDEEGAASCKPCTDTQICPTACVIPIESDNSDADLVSTSNPAEYGTTHAKSNQNASDLQRYLYIGLGSLLAVTLLAILFGKRSFIKRLDLYAVPFVYKMPGTLGSKNTWIGGLMGGIFICSFVVIGSGLVIPFLFTNIMEDRTLVPRCLATSELTGSIIMDLEFTGKFDSCVVTDSAGVSSCSDSIVFPTISTNSTVVQTCSQPPDISEGVPDQSKCSLHLEISDVELDNRMTEYPFTLSGSGEFFASSVAWSVNSTASNPGQFSTISGDLYPVPASMTFRGTSSPTEIGIFSTESMYNTAYKEEVPDRDGAGNVNENKNPSTGRIFEFIGYDRGSMVNSQNFWDQNGVSITIILERSENVLSWKLSKVQDNAAFLAALLGSLTGLQGTFGAVAGGLRRVWGVIKGKYGKDVFTRKKNKGKGVARGKTSVCPNPLVQVPMAASVQAGMLRERDTMAV